MDDFKFEMLSQKNIPEIAMLGKEYNPKLTIMILEEYLKQMFSFNNYYCFGIFTGEKLMGFLSGWLTVKFDSGKLLEVDNAIMSPAMQSKDFGVKFLAFIEAWAKKNSCKAIELNVYAQNTRAHKFLLNLDYAIVGFHFQKII